MVISDRSLLRISQAMQPTDTETLVRMLYSGSADGWYCHASDIPLLERQSGYVTLFVEAPHFADVDHYGFFFNFFKPANFVRIDDIEDEVINALEEDYEAGVLPAELELRISALVEEHGDETFSEVREDLNPDDIVDTAGWWDDVGFTYWFTERFPKYEFVITYDGAVALRIAENQGEIITLSGKEIEAIWERL